VASTSSALPPPVKGWDTRESLADMPVDHAILLDNWFPETDKITLRRGSSSHATGMTGPVETLISYVPTSGTGQLFGAANGAIYNVTASGAVGSAVSSGHSNNRWQFVNMGTAGGQFVRLFNGTDTPLLYNGSSWATTAITCSGMTAANLIWGNLHQRRLWVGEKNSLSAYYLGVNSVSGAATEFPLGGIASKGGFIQAMGTWTRDSGAGADDVAVFVTSEGEAIVYSGTDPSSASSWSLVGVFQIGKPIGRRCLVKAGSDLILMTQDGFVPLSGILSIDRSQAGMVALSDQISKAVNDAVRSYGDIFGWQPILYPKGGMLVFNIMQSTETSHQYVFNTITGAPCRFTGLNAICFGLIGDDLYFGTADGKVLKFDDGSSDSGVNIEADGLQAFSYFKSPAQNKIFKLVEPIFESDGNPNAAIDLNLDFQVKVPTGVSAASPTRSGIWGVSKWGIGIWGTAGQVYRGWRGVRGKGRAASIRIRVDTKTARPSWIATNFTYQKGGQL
tara:strand:- start:4369 stop:5883 length:1515 start_codon:yes stop_codon:yes gene_type:complete